MRDEREAFVEGLATGRIPAPGACTMDEVFMNESDQCVYGCGRLSLHGKDCCQQCLDESRTPSPFERIGMINRIMAVEEGEDIR